MADKLELLKQELIKIEAKYSTYFKDINYFPSTEILSVDGNTTIVNLHYVERLDVANDIKDAIKRIESI